jgi:hypothetical protein
VAPRIHFSIGISTMCLLLPTQVSNC